MAINFPLNDINNGDSGLSARLTLNDVIEFVNSGSQWLSGSFTGSLLGTASYALNGSTDTSSLVTTSSFNSFTSSYYADSASFDLRINTLTSESLGPGVIDVNVATSASLRLSTYYNGPSNDGVGATLTSVANGALGVIDGVTTLLNWRILVKNQASQSQNGVYQLTQTGSLVVPFILTRTNDADDSTDFTPQIVVPSTGSINRALDFAQTTESPVIGTSSIVYTQITSSNLYTFQSTVGTQALNQIPLYTSVARQLTPGSSTFTYNTSTGVFRIRNVNYTYPSTQGANGTVLMNNGAGVLRWANNFTGSFSGSFTGSLVGTASQALTASYAGNYLPLTGGTINGDLIVTGTASLAFLNAVYISSSINYASGSNQFGDDTSDIQTLIGTTIISGALQVTGSTNIPDLTGSLFGTASWAYNAVTASYVEIFPYTGSAEITGSLGVTGSFGQGLSVIVSGAYSHAEGNSTQAIGDYSHAEGDTNIASGSSSHAEGYVTLALGPASHAEGESTQALGQGSHAEGNSTQAIGNNSHTEGANTIALGTFSHAEGANVQSGWRSFATNIVAGTASIAGGDFTSAFGGGGDIITEITIYAYNSMSYDGVNTYIYINDPNAVGSYIADTQQLNNPLAVYLLGDSSHAEGNSSQALGPYSHAEGQGAISVGAYSHAEGRQTQTIGDSSHAEGVSTMK